jgi:hypothetical protein
MVQEAGGIPAGQPPLRLGAPSAPGLANAARRPPPWHRPAPAAAAAPHCGPLIHAALCCGCPGCLPAWSATCAALCLSKPWRK